MKHNAALTAFAAASVLSLAACGGGGGTPASTPASHSTSHTPAAAASAQPGGSALVTVPGYDYAKLPTGKHSMKELVQTDPQHLQSVSGKLVLHDGNMIAALVLVHVKPQYVNLPGLRQAMSSAFVRDLGGSGAKVTKQTIHTEPVTVARAGSTVTYCWFHNGAVTVVTGDSGHEIHDYVDAYLAAAHA
jgi:hypothetical protein